MPFTLAPIESLKVRIKFTIPADTGKKQKRADLLVTYRKRPVSEQKEFLEDMASRIEKEDTREDGDVLEEDILDIEGIKDTDGNDLEYSPAVLEELLEMDYVRTALIEGWAGINFGTTIMKEWRRKNSQTPGATG